MTDSKHLVSSYDRDLESIQALIMKMGGMVETAIADSVKALVERDEDLAAEVRERDRDIDAMEELVNEQAARILALRAPAASDLRTVLTVIKISASLERIGDYAKNLAKRTSVLVQMHPIDGSGGAIRRMAREVEVMLRDGLDAYVQHDVQMAADVRSRDRDVDQMYNALFRELLTHMMEDPRNITACMHLHFIVKNIERMGDLTTNIAEQVIYLVTGEIPDDERPKGDRTPFVAEPENG
ncbi:MAG: phosphate transport system regulatory protein PhoU [Alphaproteobacteria bacterium HGW-Alphaproteobacteria-2]|nr:MAG: phosphate transport system regulatory protein PhoU [Alphaproteobacteria bacterium HGW-Alphaproteobacteria-2]